MYGVSVLVTECGSGASNGRLVFAAASILTCTRSSAACHVIRRFNSAQPTVTPKPANPNPNPNPNPAPNANSKSSNSKSGGDRKYKEDFVRPSPPSLGKDMFGLKRMLTAVEFDAKGNTTDRTFSNHQITSEMNIQLRDLRNIDHAYPPQKASILVRERAIIVHIQPVRAVLQWNRMLLFTAGQDAVYTSLSPSLREYLFLQGAPGHALPFEFCALEALLIFVCEAFERRVSDLAPCIESEIKKQQTNPEIEPLTMYQHKKNLAHCETDIHEVKSALADLLQNDEDMAAMYLSIKAATGYPRRKNQHEEIETLLENYLRQIEQMEGAIRDLRESITVTEEYVNLQLDSSRNRMMRHTLGLSVGTMAASLGGLVIGAFGMNLTTGVETHPWAFWGVAAFVPATMVGVFYGLRVYLGLRNTTTIPSGIEALGKRMNHVMLPAAELLSVQQRQHMHHMLQIRMQKEQEEMLREQACGTQADIMQDLQRIKEQQQEMEHQHHKAEQQHTPAQQQQQQQQQSHQQQQQPQQPQPQPQPQPQQPQQQQTQQHPQQQQQPIQQPQQPRQPQIPQHAIQQQIQQPTQPNNFQQQNTPQNSNIQQKNNISQSNTTQSNIQQQIQQLQQQMQQQQMQQQQQTQQQQTQQQQPQTHQQDLDMIKLMEQMRQKREDKQQQQQSHPQPLSHSHLPPPRDIQQLDQELAESLKAREKMKKRGEPPNHWDALEEPIKEQKHLKS